MGTIKIDNIEIPFAQGQTILQAAKEAGIEIPHFCYHPALSIAGNCRICLVEVEKLPKLTIACSTPATNGMVVYTNSPRAIKARNAVMEFLLINHPLDCPICDEAGECKLQDYAYKYSIGASRFDEEKNHKDKRVELGPNVMFDQERCISCSRCIRFCEEIVKEPQLTFVQRGEKVTIETFPGKKLDNPYSMNVIEICPVGALTSRHFRFKARVWDMSFTNSICPGCARGCNTIIGVRNNEILRITPRENLEVNDYWLCDWGRLETIKWPTDKRLRILSPKIRKAEVEYNYTGDIQQNSENPFNEVSWDVALSRAAAELYEKKTLFIGSPFATLEDNYALKKLANEVIGTDEVYYLPFEDITFADKLLKVADRTPNSNGCKLLGFKPIDESVLNNIKSKKFELVYIMQDDLTRGIKLDDILENFESSIQQLSLKTVFSSYATVLLPQSTYAEINGTFVNFQNRIQRIRPAITTFKEDRIIGEYSISRLDRLGAHNDRWNKGYRFNSKPGWEILKQIAKCLNVDFKFENAEDVFIELCSQFENLKGWNYEVIGDKGKQILEQSK